MGNKLTFFTHYAIYAQKEEQLRVSIELETLRKWFRCVTDTH